MLNQNPDGADRIAKRKQAIDTAVAEAGEMHMEREKKAMKRVRFLNANDDATTPAVDFHARSTSGDTQMQPSSSSQILPIVKLSGDLSARGSGGQILSFNIWRCSDATVFFVHRT